MFNTKCVMSKGFAFGEDEEMKMLSSYAEKGWILYKFGILGYKLKKAKPQKLQYSLDYRSNADDEYFSYFKEAGWHHVCSLVNSMHIFSAPKGTKPIYTDSDTILEKYISQYELIKPIAISSLSCCILSFILVLLAKYNYIPDIFRKVFGIILMATAMIAIFTTLPCISYYLKINEIKSGSSATKNHKTIKKLVAKLLLIMIILLISVFLLSIFNIITISKIVLYLICLIVGLLVVFSCFIK